MAGWGQPANNSMVVFITDDSMVVNYPVAPGMTVALINANDPEKGKMYLKSTAANGMPNPVRTFEIKDVTPQKQSADTVSRQEFDKLTEQLAAMQELLVGMQKGAKK